MDWKKRARFGAVALAVMVLAAAALSSGSALAAKGSNAAGGGGKGGHKTPTPTPSTASVTLTSANPVPVGTAPSFHATGYKPGDYVYFVMSGGYIQVDGVYADATGSADYTFYQGLTNVGSYTMTSTLLNGVNSASVTFTVQ